MPSRRSFLQQVSLASAGLIAGRHNLFASKIPGNPFSGKPIGLQLYTLRDEIAKDVKGTIAKVADIGFDYVETFFGYNKAGDKTDYWGLDAKAFRGLLDEHHLKTHSGHYLLNDFLTRGNGNDEALKVQAELAATLGQTRVVAPVPPFMAIDKMTKADYQFIAAQLNKGGELCKKMNIKLGYHNHFWEFRKLEDGISGYETMLKETDPSLVDFEMDLFWVVKSGEDPVQWINRYPGRFTMWHVKDIDRSHPEKIVGGDLDKQPVMNVVKDVKFANVGTGVVDFKSIFAHAHTAGLKYYFVEQDRIDQPDKFASVKESFTYIQKNLTAR
jgi:sugar phosphate isomerase/epimerase